MEGLPAGQAGSLPNQVEGSSSKGGGVCGVRQLLIGSPNANPPVAEIWQVMGRGICSERPERLCGETLSPGGQSRGPKRENRREESVHPSDSSREVGLNL